jgi:hypothetical protein
MEEGLHGTAMTGVLNLPEDMDDLRNGRILNVKKPSDVTYKNGKFFSAGLRATLYGPASSKSHVKLGIELRDTTRDLAKLDRTMSELTNSLSSKIWEIMPDAIDAETPRLSTDERRTHELLASAGLRADSVSRFFNSEKTVGIPLNILERGPVFNFS